MILNIKFANEINETSEEYTGRCTVERARMAGMRCVAREKRQPEYRHARREKGRRAEIRKVKQKRAQGGCLGTGSR